MNRRSSVLVVLLVVVIAECLIALAGLGLLAWKYGEGITLRPGVSQPLDEPWWPTNPRELGWDRSK